jgi:hypothetical protein
VTHGRCDYCARTKSLDQHGRVVVHYLAIPVSRRAVPAVGAGRVRRRCPGSGKQPRGANRESQPGRPKARHPSDRSWIPSNQGR